MTLRRVLRLAVYRVHSWLLGMLLWIDRHVHLWRWEKRLLIRYMRFVVGLGQGLYPRR